MTCERMHMRRKRAYAADKSRIHNRATVGTKTRVDMQLCAAHCNSTIPECTSFYCFAVSGWMFSCVWIHKMKHFRGWFPIIHEHRCSYIFDKRMSPTSSIKRILTHLIELSNYCYDSRDLGIIFSYGLDYPTIDQHTSKCVTSFNSQEKTI